MPLVDIEPAKLFDSRLGIRPRIDCLLACSYGRSCGGNEDYSVKAGVLDLIEIAFYVRFACFDFDGNTFTGPFGQDIYGPVAFHRMLARDGVAFLFKVPRSPVYPKRMLKALTGPGAWIDISCRAYGATEIGQLVQDNLTRSCGDGDGLYNACGDELLPDSVAAPAREIEPLVSRYRSG